MQSVEKQIEKQIKFSERGRLFFPEDFSAFGTSEAVRKALARLEKSGLIIRAAHGIYVRPKESCILGKLIPSAAEIAEAIARRDRIRIVPTGSFALNALGLSTQVPVNLVYLTDGSPRLIRVGRQSIKFKKASPRNLMAKGKISGLVIQAIKELGNHNIQESELGRIIQLLKKEDPKTLKHDMELAPVWIQKIMSKGLPHES